MKVPLRVVNARRAHLADLVRAEGYLPVGEVCKRLKISEATARRDLAALAANQSITRTRGGVLAEYNQRFPSFRERLLEADAGKRRIAEAAHRLLLPGMTLWLDSGTTVYRLAELLTHKPVAGLVVVTNSLPAAELVADRADMSVHLLGGQFFRRSSLLVGGRALANLAEWRFDVAFLSVEGMARGGLWNSHADIAALQRDVLKRAKDAAILADASKLGREAPAFLCPWRDVPRLIIDAPIGQLAAAGVVLSRERIVSV